MARRLKRQVVGPQILALAGSLSDSLLDDEADAQAAVERKFVHALTEARDALTGRGSPAVALGGVAAGVLSRSTDTYRALLRASAEKTMTSIEAEMALCERTIAQQYQGATVDAVAAVRPLIAPRVRIGVRGYEARHQEWVGSFVDLVDAEWKAHRAGKEAPEVFAERVFSPVRVVAPGHSGRGVWWKPFQWTFAEMRAGEFVMVNQIRRQVIVDWNRAVAARG